MDEAALGAEQYWAGLQTTLKDGEILVTDSGQKPWGQVLIDRDHLLRIIVTDFPHHRA